MMLFSTTPALQLIYDTAPIGLACLSPDCRYLLINHEESESIPQDADIAAAKWKLTDLFRVGAWALSR